MTSQRRNARTVAESMLSRIERAWGESPFYQAQLRGPAPDRLLFHPVDPRTPDRAIGEALVSGRMTVSAQSVHTEDGLDRLWDLATEPGPLFSFLHDFSWLRHVEALGDKGTAPSRILVKGWLARFEKWSPEAWDPYLTGERLVQLCCHSPLLLKNADALWRSRLLTAMARQTRHLAHAGHRADTGYDRLMTALALSIAGLCLPGCEAAGERGLELLRRELRLQIRPDGGHLSRNPSRQLAIVIRLQMVLRAMEARRLPPLPFLKHVLARMAANVQFFRAGDGRLAVFHGGYEDDGRAVLSALEAADTEGAPTGFARHTGFQRLEAARAVVIADVDATPAAQIFDSAASFHFSSGRSRLLVNCGNGDHLPGEWSKALRLCAAHSTLSADNGAAIAASPGGVTHRRAEDGRGHYLEIDRRIGPQSETGGRRHIRRLYLSSQGDNLRGEDDLSGVLAGDGLRLRFHLHPSVKASLARDGCSVVLALHNREGWRFRTNVKALKLEKSVYCGDGGLPVASEQIVLELSGLVVIGEPLVVKWAFRRLDGVG